MKKVTLTSLLLLSTLLTVFAQSKIIERVEPAFWWADMPVNELQIVLYGKNIGGFSASIEKNGIKIKRQIKVDSPNYLFLYLNIEESVNPGSFPIILRNGKQREVVNYELKMRDLHYGKQGFNSSDVIYLMMPDRFANGNPSNDIIKGMREGANRADPNARHGGDFAGVAKHLDYIKDLGMTAIWFTPVFENDMNPEYGAYHGYATTDLYKIDRRFGSNEEFKVLVEKCHSMDMKVIMDMIHNHIGDKHWWMNDLPTNDWVYDINNYGTTNYRGVVASDPYSSQYDLDKLTKGWFVKEMPDLNQENPLLADYLIQNTIWWIEYSGIDGIRMDTYVYPDKHYMARWAKEVITAYPNFNIVGEAWVNTVAHEAYWQENYKARFDGYNSYLPSVTDFQMQYAIRDAFTQNEGWLEGLSRIYYTLAQDYLYNDPNKNVIFLDNHDLTRFYDQVGSDKDFFKMSYSVLMTTRGIPQVYYGTELMFGEKGGSKDGGKRPDMPGGWDGDKRSVFGASGRSDEENEIFDYVSKITNWRKNKPVIHSGKLKHFLPEDGVYVYFRYDSEDMIMVILNKNESQKKLNLSRFKELISNKIAGVDIITNKEYIIGNTLDLPAKQALILELR